VGLDFGTCNSRISKDRLPSHSKSEERWGISEGCDEIDGWGSAGAKALIDNT
jgi:hypothetical protein